MAALWPDLIRCRRHAQGAILKHAGALLVGRANELLRVVKAKATEHRDTVMVGRTHGIWAEPTTFG